MPTFITFITHAFQNNLVKTFKRLINYSLCLRAYNLQIIQYYKNILYFKQFV